MKSTLFIFGRTPDLSFFELRSLYPDARMIADRVAVVAEVLNAHDAIQRLGGTVKVAEYVTEAKLTAATVLPLLMAEAVDSHITFGVSAYGGTRVPAGLPVELKKKLRQRGVTARFIETKHDEALSSVVIAKQQVVEVVAVVGKETLILGITRAVQDFEDWNKRDFGRPAADPKAGMLPPKVARMIVNLALPGAIRQSKPSFTPTLLDPFCGVGTILSEALLLGVNVIGSDLSESAVAKTKKNLEWLRREYPAVAPLFAKTFVADATHLRTHLTTESVDAIATEPFMGDTVEGKDVGRLTPDRVKNILKGLEKLYIGSLREWGPLLKPGGRVVMAMPAYVTTRGIFRVKNVVDRCERDGYTLLTGPIEYSRPQAVVRREFYIFEKK